MKRSNIREFTNIVENIIISGISQNTIKSKQFYLFVLDIIQNNKFDNSEPEILLVFPQENHKVEKTMLKFVFPNGIDIKYNKESPKFNTILTTDVHANRSYVYILKIYEKINIEDYEYQTILKNENQDISTFEICNENNRINKDYMRESDISIKNQSVFCFEKDKDIYVPIVICLWSLHNNAEAFRGILMEIWNLISKNKLSLNEYFSYEMINNYRLIELINYFIFISGIASPPYFTQMKLNFNFSQINFFTPSKYELPHCDMNIKILFETLDTSIIIKLWTAILTEKQIIFLSHQSFLLYSVIDAFITLIFPFKWIHPCIACMNNLNFLDAPVPYIMGLLTCNVDLNELKLEFPNHIICYIDTSQLFCKPFNLLPLNEEEKIRRKIQYVRNPHIYFFEEFDSTNLENSSPTDISSKRSLSKNIQYIFFRVLRGPLENYKKKYILNNDIFDTEKFLNEHDCDEYKFFWSKIIETFAFEYFIFSDKYIDDSNNLIFNNICELNEDEAYIDENNIYKYSLNVQNYMERIEKDLDREKKYCMNFKLNIKKLIDDHKKVSSFGEQKSKGKQLNNFNDSNMSNYKFNINNNYLRDSNKESLHENIKIIESDTLIKEENSKVNEGEICIEDKYPLNLNNFLNEKRTKNFKLEMKPAISDFNLVGKNDILNIDFFINENKCILARDSPLCFYGKNNFLSIFNYLKSNIKGFGFLATSYFLKEVTIFLDKEIKENQYLSELEKFEFGNHNPLIQSKYLREREMSFNINNIKSNYLSNLEEIREEEQSLNIELKNKTLSGMNISVYLLNGEKGKEIEDNNFIEFKRCDKPQYYLLLISYFNLLRYAKSECSRKSLTDLRPSGINNTANLKKLNAARQYVLELYCKVSKFPKCEYSCLHFFNIISNLDVEITIKYLAIIPERFRSIISEKLENKNKDYDTFFSIKPKSGEIYYGNDKNGNIDNTNIIEKSPLNDKNENKKEMKKPKPIKLEPLKLEKLKSENIQSLTTRANPIKKFKTYLETITSNKASAPGIITNKIGNQTINCLFQKNPSFAENIDKKSIRYSEHYLEKLQISLNKKIKEKKITKMTTNYNSKSDDKTNLKTSVATSKLNLNTTENPFKINFKKEQEKQITEFEVEDEKNLVLEEEEQETVFKKNEQEILDMSGSCGAMKMVENMKNSNQKMMKILVLNNYNFYSEELKNSFGKSEIKIINLICDFCEKLKEIIEKYHLDKLPTEMITKDLLKNVSNDHKFIELKNKLGLLQKLNIVKPKIEEKIVFWVNTYNFLVMFTLILKNEIPSSVYEFNRILKNSFFNIGNYVMSLYIIEEVIIKFKTHKAAENDFLDFEGCFLNIKTFIKTDERLHLFALSRSFPKFYIYTLENYNHLFDENLAEYLKDNLTLKDINNKTNVYLPEYFQTIESNFLEKLTEYKKYIEPEVYEKLNANSHHGISFKKVEWEIRFDVQDKNLLKIKYQKINDK